MILVTTPAPTVLPPSRMANFRPSSQAIVLCSSTMISMLSPGHHHLHTLGQHHRARHVRRPEVELRPVALEERRMAAALLLLEDVNCAVNFLCGVIEPGLHSTWPRSTSSRFTPRSSRPTLSPAWPWSSSLRNISTPVIVVLTVS